MIGTRYTKELIDEYVAKGYRDPDLVYADFVEQCARDYPDKEAVIDPRTRLTWKQVKEQTDLIARGLIDMVQEIRPRLPELKDVIVIGDDVPPGATSLWCL